MSKEQLLIDHTLCLKTVKGLEQELGDFQKAYECKNMHKVSISVNSLIYDVTRLQEHLYNLAGHFNPEDFNEN